MVHGQDSQAVARAGEHGQDLTEYCDSVLRHINNSVVGCYTLQYRTKSCEGSLSALMVVFVGRKCWGALFIHHCLGCLGSVVKVAAVSVAFYCLFKAHGCFILVFIHLIL